MNFGHFRAAVRSYPNKPYIMSIFRALVVLCLASSIVGCGGEGSGTGVTGSKPAQSTLSAGAGNSPALHDYLVVFEDKLLQNEITQIQAKTGLASNHAAIIGLKAMRFAQLKRQTLQAMSLGEATVLQEYGNLPISFMRLRDANSVTKIKTLPGIVGTFENSVMHRAGLAQSLPLIHQPQAVAAGALGASTTVAVLDQRADYSNSVFGGCTAPGQPSGCKVIIAQDAPGLLNDGLGFQDGHGTNVAATVVSVAPRTQIVSLNVFNGESASTSTIVGAINWCITNASTLNIVAMNISLGDSTKNTAPITTGAYFTAFANAKAAGIIPVVAAGNNGYSNALAIPGAVAGAVSVGAVYDSASGPQAWVNCKDSITYADEVTCFSDSYPFLSVLAPGCHDDAAGITMCGTSQAAPHVAGAVAVLRSAFPSESLAQTISRLESGDLVTDSRNGIVKPRLNLSAALNLPTCQFNLSANSATFSANGGTGSFTVTTSNGCAWTTVSSANWISIRSGSAGVGSGTINYSIAPNAGSSAIVGSILVGGMNYSISQAAGISTSSNTANVYLVGNYQVQLADDNSTLTFNIDEILNNSQTSSTGTLRLELWLTAQTFDSSPTGYRVASYQIQGSSNGTLGPRQYFANINATAPVALVPPPGVYVVTLLVTEYRASCSTADHFCLDTEGAFMDNFFIPDLSPPTVPSGLSAQVVSPTQINLAWNASSDNVGVTAYKVYSSGTLLGRVSSPGASVSSLAPSTSYQFTVTACDAAENCSPQSSLVQATTPFAFSSGWWWNPAESGRGFAIEQLGNDVFMAGFLYASNGKPTWFISTGKMNGTSFSHPMTVYSGGQSLTGSYVSPTQSPASPGNITLNFSDPSNATMIWPGGTVALQRFEFAPGGLTATPTSFMPERGWWWNAGESGRGYAIEIQGTSLFMAGFMYDASGEPAWYVSAGSMTDPATYQGNWVNYSGGQTMTSSYQAPSSSTQGPPVAIKFSDTRNGTLTLPNETISITRFNNF